MIKGTYQEGDSAEIIERPHEGKLKRWLIKPTWEGGDTEPMVKTTYQGGVASKQWMKKKT